jgi:hypothetical protein
MYQKKVRDPAKAIQRVIFIGANRLLGAIAAGGHNWESKLFHH